LPISIVDTAFVEMDACILKRQPDRPPPRSLRNLLRGRDS